MGGNPDIVGFSSCSYTAQLRYTEAMVDVWLNNIGKLIF
jgi:hypothetical protein